tara:strand:+ start:1038 stop:2258 length:1221 start_codon:yes stop_codon:yes gene_type:complete
MRLGIFNYSDNSGGAARASYRIHQSLLDEGVTSSFYVSKKTLSNSSIKLNPYFIEKYLLSIRQKTSSLLLKTLISNSEDYRSLSLLPSMWPSFINKSDLDIVHLNWINAEMMSVSDIKKILKPIVWTFHDMWPILGILHISDINDISKANNYKNKIYKNLFDLDKWTYERKKRNWINPFNIVTPSKWLEDCVKNNELMKNWNITTINHPVDTDFWKPVSKAHAKKLLGIEPNMKIILYGADGGTSSYNKGFDMLINALNKLEMSKTKTRLCIFGKDLEDIKISIPFTNFGKIEDDNKLRLIYSAADICVVPSRVESFCQVAVEAQSCGTPVICFSIGGLIDVVEHGKTGFLVQPFNIDNLSFYIKNYINEEYEHLNFNQESRNRAINFFSKSSIAKKYINLYESLK